MDFIKNIPLSPAVTGALLFALTKAPEKYRAQLLERLGRYLSRKNIDRTITGLKWLFALGLTRNVHVFLSEIAQNNFRIRSERYRYVWDREVAVVTGAASGFGALMAKSLAAKGINVMAVDIRDELPEDMRNTKKIHYHKCNVTDREAVMKLAQDIQKDHGDVSILINNAGVSTPIIFRYCPEMISNAATTGSLRAHRSRRQRESHQQLVRRQHHLSLLDAASFLAQHDQEQEGPCGGHSINGVLHQSTWPHPILQYQGCSTKPARWTPAGAESYVQGTRNQIYCRTSYLRRNAND